MFGASSGAGAVLKAIKSTQAVVQFKPDGTIIDANTLFLDLLGYQREEVVGRHHSLFVTDAEANSAEYRSFWSALAGGKAQTAEFKRITKSGQPVWIQASYTPIVERGRVTRVIKFASDITDKKLSQADNESQIAAIHRAQAVIEFDLDGTILTANDNFLNLLGYRLEEVQGQHHRIFVDPDEARSPAYRQFWDDLRQGRFQTADYRRITKSLSPATGSVAWCPVSMASPSRRICWH
ncbi:PAS domain S-box-containing protein [Tamilnaduibacter salinus]|uniref:PAS domain S-box-containing protein n=1 Tax=Tamilnaduibacter salinus TaxID=1484056 RepID=A0A2U1CYH9_9GAMM|nr:PAS domain-containing protein [Tamilnaduibacter salinus]PVY77546.1 PAS domain S-box-containing protein [Tamilnaduibacter salinus]